MGPEDRKGPDENSPDYVPPACGEDDGVDMSLIRWMLSLTPKERLKVLQKNRNAMLNLSHAKRKG